MSGGLFFKSGGKEFHKLMCRHNDCLSSDFKELHKLMSREGDCLVKSSIC